MQKTMQELLKKEGRGFRTGQDKTGQDRDEYQVAGTNLD
jgi:hypothetical protein